MQRALPIREFCEGCTPKLSGQNAAQSRAVFMAQYYSSIRRNYLRL